MRGPGRACNVITCGRPGIKIESRCKVCGPACISANMRVSLKAFRAAWEGFHALGIICVSDNRSGNGGVSKLRRVPALLFQPLYLVAHCAASRARPVGAVVCSVEAFGVSLGRRIYIMASIDTMVLHGFRGAVWFPRGESPPITRPARACDRLGLSVSKPALRRAGPAYPKLSGQA